MHKKNRWPDPRTEYKVHPAAVPDCASHVQSIYDTILYLVKVFKEIHINILFGKTLLINIVDFTYYIFQRNIILVKLIE